MLHAVVIGIDRYQDFRIDDLSCAVADARAVASLLERRLAPDERTVRLLLDEAATERAISIAVEDDLHRDVAPDDLVMIYFAGHGSPELTGRNDRRGRFLLPHDVDFDRIYSTGLGMETVIPDWLERLSSARLTALVLDCCFSGAAGGRTVMGPLLRSAGERRTLSPADAPVSLKELELGRGRVILCASDEDQVARENRRLGHGVFTRHFLAALTRPRGGERVVPLTTLYAEVEAAVRDDTDGAQEPVITLIPGIHARLPCLA